MSDNSHTSILENDGVMDTLKNKNFPNISLPNQDGNLLNLHRLDTFRMVLYFYPMTGRPDRPLPDNWNNIPGAKGCTIQTCSFRDNYDEIISLNAVPIGISSQSVDDNKEMTGRLKVPYDVLSDEKKRKTYDKYGQNGLDALEKGMDPEEAGFGGGSFGGFGGGF